MTYPPCTILETTRFPCDKTAEVDGSLTSVRLLVGYIDYASPRVSVRSHCARGGCRSPIYRTPLAVTSPGLVGDLKQPHREIGAARRAETLPEKNCPVVSAVVHVVHDCTMTQESRLLNLEEPIPGSQILVALNKGNHQGLQRS